MAKNRNNVATRTSADDDHVQEFLDMIAPSIIKFNTEHFICGNTYRCVWALREYPTCLLYTMKTAKDGMKNGKQ